MLSQEAVDKLNNYAKENFNGPFKHFKFLEDDENFKKALDKWLGNNGNEDQESSFAEGWIHALTNEEPDFSEAFGCTYDWNAGFKASREYLNENN